MVDGAIPEGQPVLTRLAGLSKAQADGVTRLAAAVAAADGIEAFSEQMLLNLTDSHREVTHLLLARLRRRATAEVTNRTGQAPPSRSSATPRSTTAPLSSRSTPTSAAADTVATWSAPC